MPATSTIGEILGQIRSQVPETFRVIDHEVDPLVLQQGEVAELRTSVRGGAEVCKFVLGVGHEAQLVTLQKQSGGNHPLAGIVHTVRSYSPHWASSYVHRYRFANGRPITPEDGESILKELAEKKQAKVRALGGLGLGT